MAEPTAVPLGLSSAIGRTPAEGGARLINCLADRAGEQAKHGFPIYAAAGFDLFADLTNDGANTGTGAIRGGIVLDDVLYVATGTKIAKVAADGTVTILDGSIDADGLVSMARNRKIATPQIAIVTSSGHLYSLEDDVLEEVDLGDLEAPGVPIWVTVVDGYFVILFSDGEFYISGVDNIEIDPLDFAKAEANPDGGVQVSVLGRDVIIFGPQSTEFWQNTGFADFPLERAMTRSFGCYAAGSVQNLVQTRGGSEIADTLVFAATDSNGGYIGICVMAGTSPTKISPPALDRAILAEADVSAIRSLTWSDGERSFYAIVGSAFSYVYDFSTGFWHERQSDALSIWRIVAGFTFGAKTIVGDYANGNIYWMRSGLYNASSPSILTFRHSDDGGQSWRATRTREISGASNQTQRHRFNRIGRAKQTGKVFELLISEAVMENGTGLSMSIRTPIVHAWPAQAKMAAAHLDVVPGVSETARAKGILSFALQSDLTTEQAH